MKMRMISREANSMVYHRPECRHAQSIKKNNRVQMPWEEAEWNGYRPCKCCNNMEFLYQQEQFEIESYAAQYNLEADIKNHMLYVRTEVGCWKIMYMHKKQKFTLYHRNYVNGRVRLADVERAPYHQQKDKPVAKSIMSYMDYIRKHDEFIQSMPSDFRLSKEDYRKLPRATAKQRHYYNAARKREERRKARRVDNLFLLIEQQEGMRELSFC